MFSFGGHSRLPLPGWFMSMAKNDRGETNWAFAYAVHASSQEFSNELCPNNISWAFSMLIFFGSSWTHYHKSWFLFMAKNDRREYKVRVACNVHANSRELSNELCPNNIFWAFSKLIFFGLRWTHYYKGWFMSMAKNDRGETNWAIACKVHASSRKVGKGLYFNNFSCRFSMPVFLGHPWTLFKADLCSRPRMTVSKKCVLHAKFTRVHVS